MDNGGYKAMIYSGTSQHMSGDIRGDQSGAAWELPAGSQACHGSGFQPSLFPRSALGARMKSLKYTWQNDAQGRLMHLAPIKMLEEKRI